MKKNMMVVPLCQLNLEYNRYMLELYKHNSGSIDIADHLAISYSSLGRVYRLLDKTDNARSNFIEASKMWNFLCGKTQVHKYCQRSAEAQLDAEAMTF